MPGGTLDKYIRSGDTDPETGLHLYTFRGFDWISCADDDCGKRVKTEGERCELHADN